MGIAEALLFLAHEEDHKLKIKHNAFEELTKISHALGPSQSHFCFFLMISKKERCKDLTREYQMCTNP